MTQSGFIYLSPGPTRSNAMGPDESERAKRDFLALADALRRDPPYGLAIPIKHATDPPIVHKINEIDRLAGEVARICSYAAAVDAAELRRREPRLG